VLCVKVRLIFRRKPVSSVPGLPNAVFRFAAIAQVQIGLDVSLGFCRPDVPDQLEQAAVVEPVHVTCSPETLPL